MIKLGLIGEKLSHSISPDIHKLILEELNIKGEYRLYEIKPEELRNGIMELREKGLRGINVTIPYKIAVMDFLDEISPEAKSIGSVNTIMFTENGLKGYNTDYFGFKSTLESFAINIIGKSVLILGTGGGAAAVYQCVSDLGAGEIKLVTRKKTDIKPLWKSKNVDIISYEDLESYRGNILVNCTPVGMFPGGDASPLDMEMMRGYEAAVDLIYNPEETKFLSYARALRMKTAGGLHMLIGQAVKSEEVWNNLKIEKNIVKNVSRNIGKL